MTNLIEIAVSLNFKKYSDRPDIVVDSRSNAEYVVSQLDTKILIYEDRVAGWFFQYGKLLKQHHDAGFIVLQTALAQVEGIEQYRRGESSDKKSGEFFQTGLKRIFCLDDSADVWLNKFYSLVRCGLFHDGMIRAGVRIENRFTIALEYRNDQVYISPNKFIDAVEVDFISYIGKLKQPGNTELRSAFLRKWDGIV